jgi:hypothetical protein
MPLPSPSPATDAVTSHRGRLADLERHGSAVLRRYSPSQLATALHAAVYVEQLEGRLAPLDLDRVEDLSGLIQRLEREDEQARAQ